MATTKITSPELFDLGSLNTALKLPSGTTAERPTSPSTGEWRYNTTTNLVEFWDGGEWRDYNQKIYRQYLARILMRFYIQVMVVLSQLQALDLNQILFGLKVRSTTVGTLADSTRGTGKASIQILTNAKYLSAQRVITSLMLMDLL